MSAYCGQRVYLLSLSASRAWETARFRLCPAHETLNVAAESVLMVSTIISHVDIVGPCLLQTHPECLLTTTLMFSRCLLTSIWRVARIFPHITSTLVDECAVTVMWKACWWPHVSTCLTSRQFEAECKIASMVKK